MNKIYLDHSATTPVDARVVKAMSEYMLNAFGNPSSIHGFGRIAKEGIENARDQIALLLNCYSSDIYLLVMVLKLIILQCSGMPCRIEKKGII